MAMETTRIRRTEYTVAVPVNGESYEAYRYDTAMCCAVTVKDSAHKIVRSQALERSELLALWQFYGAILADWKL